MDIRAVAKQSWNLLWIHKSLWFFGFFVAGGGGAGGAKPAASSSGAGAHE